MASVQYYKTCEQSCQQKSQHGSLGQKVSDMFKGHHNHHNAGTHAQTQYDGQTQMLSQPGYAATTKTQTEYRYSQTQTTQGIVTGTGTSSSRRLHGRSRREHKGNMFQKIKDGLSGHNSGDSCSSSESESDSDIENYYMRKHCN